MDELEKIKNDLKKIRLAKSREFDSAHVEYYQYLIKHYNENPLNAFTTFVHLRDEIKNHIPNKKLEITGSISHIVDDAKKFDPEESLLKKIEELLYSQLHHPNLDLYDDVENLVISNSKEEDTIYDRFPHYSMKAIDDLVTKSRQFRMTMIFYTVVFHIVDDIIDYALPIEFNIDKRQAKLDAFIVEVPVEEPSKNTVYKWYGEILHANKNDLEVSFNILIETLIKRGLSLKELRITTTDPDNFYRSYTTWLNKGKDFPKL